MNENVLTELKVVVERAVRPVRSSLPHKRRMREELLAHLVGTFDEELARLGDEQSALCATKRRFGDPEELSSQIQAGVSRWARLQSVLDKVQRYRRGESLLHFAGRCVVLNLLWYPIMILFALPLLLFGRSIEFATVARFFLVMTMVQSVLMFFLEAGGKQMARAMYSAAPRRPWRKIVVSSLASLAVFPLTTVLIYGGLLIDLSTSLFYLRMSCYLAPLAPVLLIGVASCMAEEIRHEGEWGSLQIDE